jgi:hypothetical protein
LKNLESKSTEFNDNEHFVAIAQRFPHIASNIARLWHRAELNDYIISLLVDTRGDRRKGFPLATALSLIKLLDVEHRDDLAR